MARSSSQHSSGSNLNSKGNWPGIVQNCSKRTLLDRSFDYEPEEFWPQSARIDFRPWPPLFGALVNSQACELRSKIKGDFAKQAPKVRVISSIRLCQCCDHSISAKHLRRCRCTEDRSRFATGIPYRASLRSWLRGRDLNPRSRGRGIMSLTSLGPIAPEETRGPGHPFGALVNSQACGRRLSLEGGFARLPSKVLGIWTTCSFPYCDPLIDALHRLKYRCT